MDHSLMLLQGNLDQPMSSLMISRVESKAVRIVAVVDSGASIFY